MAKNYLASDPLNCVQQYQQIKKNCFSIDLRCNLNEQVRL